jgi:MspA
MLLRRLAVVAAFLLVPMLTAPLAWAEPEVDPAPPVDDGRVVSPAPATTKTPDGWTITVGAKEETQMPVAPLTTALSSREYVVGGTFNGSIRGPGEEARGVLEVGYHIGCGIDMSTSNGVTLTGSVGFTAGTVFSSAGAVPTVLAPVSGGIAIALKPGIVNIVPVNKKEFKGADPWVMISSFHIKIDGCVGQSYIRSYATLTRSTEISDSILSYVGTTKAV